MTLRVLEALGEPVANGGEEAFLAHVIEVIDMRDLEIDFFTPYQCTNMYYKSTMESKGGTVYSLGLKCIPGKSRRNIAKPFKEFLRKHQYDLIHIHSGSISALAIMSSVAHHAGIQKIIVHSHLAGEKDDLKHKVLRFLGSFSMRHHVNIYCACSREAAYWKFAPQLAQKCQVIHNGIDTEKFRYNSIVRDEMRRKLGLSGKFVVGHVGRFQREKNHDFLIDFANVIPEAHFLFIGSGPEEKRIQKLAYVRGISGRVSFAGNVVNVNEYLQAMDVFVLPSLYEGLPISVIEAQCAGLPVVLSNRVTRDAALEKNVAFLPLADMESWIGEIRKMRYVLRKDNSLLVRESGYDISTTAETIRQMYLRKE